MPLKRSIWDREIGVTGHFVAGVIGGALATGIICIGRDELNRYDLWLLLINTLISGSFFTIARFIDR